MDKATIKALIVSVVLVIVVFSAGYLEGVRDGSRSANNAVVKRAAQCSEGSKPGEMCFTIWEASKK